MAYSFEACRKLGFTSRNVLARIIHGRTPTRRASATRLISGSPKRSLVAFSTSTSNATVGRFEVSRLSEPRRAEIKPAEEAAASRTCATLCSLAQFLNRERSRVHVTIEKTESLTPDCGCPSAFSNKRRFVGTPFVQRGPEQVELFIEWELGDK